MPAETNLQTTQTLSADVVAEYIKDKLLERPERQTVFWALADKTDQPKGQGKVCQFVRYERLPLPVAPLEEGVTPTATPLTLSTVQAVVDQWGAYCSMSDMAQLTLFHPLVQNAKEVLNLQHKETVDREAQMPLLGMGSVYFANSKASRGVLTASDTLQSDDLRRTVATLRANGARTRTAGRYDLIVDPYVEGDLHKDTTFVTAGAESQVSTLNEFEIGKWMGATVMRSNLIPILTLMTAAHVTVASNTTVTSGGVGFDAGSTVRTKVTRLDGTANFETVIDVEEAITNGAVFQADITIATGAPSGVYFVYSTLQGGATGTATRQVRVNHTTGVASIVIFVKSGAPTAVNAFVVTGSGAVAPATPPAAVSIHVSYLLGKGSLGATKLDTLHTYMTEPNKPTDSDPLAQRTKTGWKFPFKALILNPAFAFRIESASAFG
jgi:N4-gp56 family major capsid protein